VPHVVFPLAEVHLSFPVEMVALSMSPATLPLTYVHVPVVVEGFALALSPVVLPEPVILIVPSLFFVRTDVDPEPVPHIYRGCNRQISSNTVLRWILLVIRFKYLDQDLSFIAVSVVVGYGCQPVIARVVRQ